LSVEKPLLYYIVYFFIHNIISKTTNQAFIANIDSKQIEGKLGEMIDKGFEYHNNKEIKIDVQKINQEEAKKMEEEKKIEEARLKEEEEKKKKKYDWVPKTASFLGKIAFANPQHRCLAIFASSGFLPAREAINLAIFNKSLTEKELKDGVITKVVSYYWGLTFKAREEREFGQYKKDERFKKWLTGYYVPSRTIHDFLKLAKRLNEKELASKPFPSDQIKNIVKLLILLAKEDPSKMDPNDNPFEYLKKNFFKKYKVTNLRQFYMTVIVKAVPFYTDEEIHKITDFAKTAPIEWDTIEVLKFNKEFSFYIVPIKEILEVIQIRADDGTLLIRLMEPFVKFSRTLMKFYEFRRKAIIYYERKPVPPPKEK